MKLEGKTIFITGASTGIGRELAIQLARKQCKLALLARSEDKLQHLRKELITLGIPINIYPVDVTDRTALEKAMLDAHSTLGGLDVIFANAGVGYLLPAHKLKAHQVEKMVSVNYLAAMNTLLIGLPLLLEQGGGQLVGISSIASIRGLPNSAVYSSSKAGLNTFLETLRVEYRRKNIEVTTVCPGFIRTPMTAPLETNIPFILDVDKAVRIIIAGVEKGRGIVGVPGWMYGLLRIMRLIPSHLYDRLASMAR
ncbi:MAG: SDR family NAD(P)-dependent oxidoreductase [Gammaproteobacteria bacterium]|nr:SDR family NAD(P)-dependent oxidoreductase [Gammaproteobacteria bacterium]